MANSYLIQQLRALRPGEMLVYFVGYLDAERAINPHGQDTQIANVAYQLFEEGKILLTQMRLGPPITREGVLDWKNGLGGGFKYMATGAHPRIRRSKFFLNPAIGSDA